MGDRLTPMVQLALVVLTLWLAGCAGSPPTKFYTLHPDGHREGKSHANTVSIYLKQVEIPDYLDRPQIVTRSGTNELNLAEYHRWGGSLGEEMTTVVVEHLSRLLDTERVYSNRGIQGEKAEYTVALRVLRLDCTPGEEVLLRAQWIVRCNADGRKAAIRTATFTEPLKDRTYPTMVQGVGKVLEEVSAEIAREIPQ